MRYFYLSFVFSTIFFRGFSQSDTSTKATSKLYVTWGYTRATYSKSSLHFKNSSGDAFVTDDRPDFDKIKDVINITIPQFVFRIGYSINSKWGVELSYDHTKYVVNDWQKARVKGQINGYALVCDTILNPSNFLHFEHTDGANFWMVNAVRSIQFFKPSKNLIVSVVLKPGAGVVIPRTDVTLFGERLNNNWHVAGWIVGFETGLRIEFLKNGFFEFVGKGSHANYTNSLVLGKGNGQASHKIFTGQLTATIGLNFGLKK